LDLALPIRAELDLTLKKKTKKVFGPGLGPAISIPFILFLSVLISGQTRNSKKSQEFQEKKSKIRCLWIQLNFIEGLIEFMEGLITRKIDF